MDVGWLEYLSFPVPAGETAKITLLSMADHNFGLSSLSYHSIHL
jgi:hypothetical protein